MLISFFYGILIVISLNFGSAEELDEDFRKRFPYSIEGTTYDGGPVLTVPFGDWDIPEALQKGEREKLRTLYYEIFQKLVNLSKGEEEGEIKSGISIFDMTKFTLHQGFHGEANGFMMEMVSAFEKKYDTRILKHWYLVNTPAPFGMAYNLLKLFLPKEARAKWQVYGTRKYKWQWEIFKYVSPEQLPERYGGVKDSTETFLSLF